MHSAVYAGFLDPPTNGHLWMIKHGLKLFDHLKALKVASAGHKINSVSDN